MKKFTKNQFDFMLEILRHKDKERELEVARAELKGTGFVLLQDHPRYGELIAYCPEYKINESGID